ncbi:uncharacterized protein LOC121752930 [Salvia splendens]|uniref:uncharacterized protein LOC121752930 n=1 Tax=Salvia splendens TaxID=180675 RepID=UPI001C26777A|nr:uncharacterized protein LOC121752930 [Salvia splendens]
MRSRCCLRLQPTPRLCSRLRRVSLRRARLGVGQSPPTPPFAASLAVSAPSKQRRGRRPYGGTAVTSACFLFFSGETVSRRSTSSRRRSPAGSHPCSASPLSMLLSGRDSRRANTAAVRARRLTVAAVHAQAAASPPLLRDSPFSDRLVKVVILSVARVWGCPPRLWAAVNLFPADSYP